MRTDLKKQQENILDFLHQAEKVKTILRHSWLSSGRRESVGEHTWRMALMAITLYENLEKKNKVNLGKTLKIILLHDLVEVYAGDYPAWKNEWKQKHEAEKKGMIKILKRLPKNLRQEFLNLWLEYEAQKSAEAKFAKALDRLEVLIQHDEADMKYFVKKEYKFNLFYGLENCEYDAFLKAFRRKINANFLKKYKKHRISKSLYQ